jgi:hypothetical protein
MTMHTRRSGRALALLMADVDVALDFFAGSVIDAAHFGSFRFGQREVANEAEKGVAACASIQLCAHTGSWVAAERAAELLLLYSMGRPAVISTPPLPCARLSQAR